MITNTMPAKSTIAFSAFSLFLSSILFEGCAGTGATLRIVDCNGSTKALDENASGSANVVKVTTISAGAAPSLTLTNSESNQLTATVNDGVAVFPGVPPGTWVLTSAAPAYLSDIELEHEEGSPWGEAALIGAGIAAAIIIYDHNNGGGHGSPPASGPTCPTCNPDDDAPSIDPFALRR